MKGLYKFFLVNSFLLLSFNLFCQNEYDDDESDFVGIKTKKTFEGKRNFNIHLSAGYTMSTVFGKDVNITIDTLNAIKNRFNLNSYLLEPNYSPYAALDLSFNFSRKISLTIGLKYNNLGWKEVAKYEDFDYSYKFYSRYDFHYLSTGISLQGHLNKYISVYGGNTFSILFKNDIFIREIEVYRANTLIDTKETEEFSKLTNVKSKVLVPQFFIGTHIGLDRIRVNLNLNYTPNFIRRDIGFSNIAVEAGILFKIFKDYDKI